MPLSSVHHFCLELKQMMSDPRLKQRGLVYYAEGDRMRYPLPTLDPNPEPRNLTPGTRKLKRDAVSLPSSNLSV